MVVLRSLAAACLLSAVIAAADSSQLVGAQPSASERAGGWVLVWSDEFNYEGSPDPAKWSYEVGFLRNQEKQYYTNARKENCRVEHGMLVIEARKETFPIPRQPGKTPVLADYTSASIETRGKASWQYGRIEMRAKLPSGLGVWPAFWTLGESGHWPACGEIDIMEFVGHTPDRVYGTLHWSADNKHASQGGNLKVNKPWEGFHVYAVEWTAERMDFFYDDSKYSSLDLSKADDRGDNAFRHPHYIKLNLAIGGSWGGKIDQAIFPQQLVVDWVRVYQKKK